MNPYIRHVAQLAKGWMPDAQGYHLWQTAFDVLDPYDIVVEIGSYCGKSTLYLGDACMQKNATLFSVDHHHGSPEHQPGQLFNDPELTFLGKKYQRVETLADWRTNIVDASAGSGGRLEECIVGMVGTSNRAAQIVGKRRVNILFLDGAHEYDAVSDDFFMWERTLVQHNPYVILHDCDPGVGPYKLWNELQSAGWRPVSEEGSLKVLGKR